jgi:hypothetical protein
MNRRKDGELYEEEMTIAPVRDSTGAITDFIAFKQDVTERNRAREELLFKTAVLGGAVGGDAGRDSGGGCGGSDRFCEPAFLCDPGDFRGSTAAQGGRGDAGAIRREGGRLRSVCGEGAVSLRASG